MNIERFRKLVKSLDHFLPFSPGEDPVLWAQVNTVKRIQEYLQKMTDTENLNLDDRKTEVECDHKIPDPITKMNWVASALGHQFCPKCGEKL